MNAMSKRAAILIFVLLFATLGVRGETPNAQPEKKHQYVLVLRPKANAAKKEPNLEKIGGKELKRWRKGRLIEVPLSALEHLRKDPTVAYLALVNDGSEPEAPTYVIGEAEEESAMKVETNGDDTPPLWDSGLYAYDGAGNIKAIGPDTYKYDHAQRLSAAVVGGESLSYTYDSFGNQVQRVIGPAIVPTPTDALTNHLENADYDPAGNQLSKSGYTQEYRYDALNMMVERGTGLPSRYIYTADDERIGVEQDFEWTWTIRDFSGKVLSTFESTDLDELWTWSWVESHHYRDGALTSAIKMEERTANRPGRYFHLDHLGTPRLITDGTGFKISRHDLHPFGKEQTNYTQEVVDWKYNSIEPMKFTGHERDYEVFLDSNRHDYLDYMHARYYNPPLGRFLSVDPKSSSAQLARPQTWNRYAYARNNPLKFVDADGRDVTLAPGLSRKDRDRIVTTLAKAARNPDFKKRLMAAEASAISVVLTTGKLRNDVRDVPNTITGAINYGFTGIQRDAKTKALTITAIFDFSNVDFSKKTLSPTNDVVVAAHELDHTNNFLTPEGRQQMIQNQNGEEENARLFGEAVGADEATKKKPTRKEREEVDALLRDLNHRNE